MLGGDCGNTRSRNDTKTIAPSLAMFAPTIQAGFQTFGNLNVLAERFNT